MASGLALLEAAAVEKGRFNYLPIDALKAAVAPEAGAGFSAGGLPLGRVA